jgi:hypothetical protein
MGFVPHCTYGLGGAIAVMDRGLGQPDRSRDGTNYPR